MSYQKTHNEGHGVLTNTLLHIRDIQGPILGSQGRNPN
jgi:hypothetical protein